MKREDVVFNESYFDYENEIFNKLNKYCDKMFIIDNNDNIDLTISNIVSIIEGKKRRGIKK